MPLAIFRGLNWTMKYGYCEYSSVAFATTGMILTGVLNDLQGGSKYGEQALALMARSKAQATSSRTMFCVYSFLFPWTKPIGTLLKPLLRSYDLGLQSGYVYMKPRYCLFNIVSHRQCLYIQGHRKRHVFNNDMVESKAATWKFLGASGCRLFFVLQADERFETRPSCLYDEVFSTALSESIGPQQRGQPHTPCRRLI